MVEYRRTLANGGGAGEPPLRWLAQAPAGSLFPEVERLVHDAGGRTLLKEHEFTF
jgi:hypothetical protein